ncbi:unnamed protein product [Rangifer tarandus platyrhynchus]|uniref:Uncharacterized protein n=1 Tax=Rangifer tarandus platyrhynchus TaxID=3082113 RepID=A0ABN9A079_RANTA|nr:unnamed protein product [Rangifer tarandus platyrhynchus]
MRSSQVWGCVSLGPPGGSGEPGWFPNSGKTHPGFAPMVVCGRGEGVARPGLPTRRPPAFDGKARDNFTLRGRCCAREEKGQVGDGDGGRWVCLEAGSQDPLPGACPKPPLLWGHLPPRLGT